MNPGNFQYRMMSQPQPRMPMPMSNLIPGSRPQPSWYNHMDWANMTDREYSDLMSMQNYYWQGYTQGQGRNTNANISQKPAYYPPWPKQYQHHHFQMQPPSIRPPIPIPKYIPPLMGTPIPRPTIIPAPTPISRSTSTPTTIPMPRMPSWVRMPLNIGAELPTPLKLALQMPLSTPLPPPTPTVSQSEETIPSTSDSTPSPTINLKTRVKTRKFRTPRVGRHLAQAAIFRVKTRARGSALKRLTPKPEVADTGNSAPPPNLAEISEWPELPPPLPAPKPVIERPRPVFAWSLRSSSTPTTTTTSTTTATTPRPCTSNSIGNYGEEESSSNYAQVIQRVIARLEETPKKKSKKQKEEIILDFSKVSDWPALPGQDEEQQSGSGNASISDSGSLWSNPPQIKSINSLNPLGKPVYIANWSSTPIGSYSELPSLHFENSGSGLDNSSWNSNDWCGCNGKYVMYTPEPPEQGGNVNLNFTETSEWPPLPQPGSFNSREQGQEGHGWNSSKQNSSIKNDRGSGSTSPSSAAAGQNNRRSKDYYLEVFTRAAQSGKEFIPSAMRNQVQAQAKVEPISSALCEFKHLSEGDSEFSRGNGRFRSITSESEYGEDDSTSLDKDNENEIDPDPRRRSRQRQTSNKRGSLPKPKKEIDPRSNKDQGSLMRYHGHDRVPTPISKPTDISSVSKKQNNSSSSLFLPQYFDLDLALKVLYPISGNWKRRNSQSPLKFKRPSRFTLHEMKHHLRVVRLKGIKRCGF